MEITYEENFLTEEVAAKLSESKPSAEIAGLIAEAIEDYDIEVSDSPNPDENEGFLFGAWVMHNIMKYPDSPEEEVFDAALSSFAEEYGDDPQEPDKKPEPEPENNEIEIKTSASAQLKFSAAGLEAMIYNNPQGIWDLSHQKVKELAEHLDIEFKGETTRDDASIYKLRIAILSYLVTEKKEKEESEIEIKTSAESKLKFETDPIYKKAYTEGAKKLFFRSFTDISFDKVMEKGSASDTTLRKLIKVKQEEKEDVVERWRGRNREGQLQIEPEMQRLAKELDKLKSMLADNKKKKADKKKKASDDELIDIWDEAEMSFSSGNTEKSMEESIKKMEKMLREMEEMAKEMEEMNFDFQVTELKIKLKETRKKYEEKQANKTKFSAKKLKFESGTIDKAKIIQSILNNDGFIDWDDMYFLGFTVEDIEEAQKLGLWTSDLIAGYKDGKTNIKEMAKEKALIQTEKQKAKALKIIEDIDSGKHLDNIDGMMGNAECKVPFSAETRLKFETDPDFKKAYFDNAKKLGFAASGEREYTRDANPENTGEFSETAGAGGETQQPEQQTQQKPAEIENPTQVEGTQQQQQQQTQQKQPAQKPEGMAQEDFEFREEMKNDYWEITDEYLDEAQSLNVTFDEIKDFQDNGFYLSPGEIAEANSLGLTAIDVWNAWDKAGQPSEDIPISEIPTILARQRYGSVKTLGFQTNIVKPPVKSSLSINNYENNLKFSANDKKMLKKKENPEKTTVNVVSYVDKEEKKRSKQQKRDDADIENNPTKKTKFSSATDAEKEEFLEDWYKEIKEEFNMDKVGTFSGMGPEMRKRMIKIAEKNGDTKIQERMETINEAKHP